MFLTIQHMPEIRMGPTFPTSPARSNFDLAGVMLRNWFFDVRGTGEVGTSHTCRKQVDLSISPMPLPAPQ